MTSRAHLAPDALAATALLKGRSEVNVGAARVISKKKKIWRSKQKKNKRCHLRAHLL